MVMTQTATRDRVGRPARDEQEFLAAAVPVFAGKGFDGSSMEDLAAAAATTKPTLYARFGSKGELYERVVRREADAFIETILASYEEIAAEPSIYVMTERTMRLWFEYMEANPAVLDLLFSPDRSPAAQRIAADVEEQIIEGLAGLMEAAMSRADRKAPAQARFLAAMAFGATLHASRHHIRQGLLDTDHAIALASSFFDAGHHGVDLELIERPASR
jgi:AcrR family transcriptional regulator